MAIRIIIADDNEVARARLNEAFQGRDHWRICGQAEDGQQALSQAIELKPDIVILDLAMPVMDGLSAAREIAKALPTVPIVLFTLHKLDVVALEAKKAGARQIVEKFDIDALLNAVEDLTKNRTPHAEDIAEPLVSASGPLDVTNAVNIAVKVPAKVPVEVHPAANELPARDEANPDTSIKPN